jgi:AmmeMemoRadiSam system protein B/AmmeMemoRadiSam system protein A
MVSGVYSATHQSFQAHLTGWYPTEKNELATLLDHLDYQAREQYAAAADKTIRALVVPHAGYTYSGVVAAAAYRLLDKAVYKTVFVICPAHAELFDGIGLPTFSKYVVPNGTVTIARSLVEKLATESPFVYDDISYQQEHAIEIQLPFIKHYMPKAQVVPLIIGNVSAQQLQDAAQVLAPLITKKTLVVISTDFTHYGKRFVYTPFGDYQSLRIRQLDNQALALIQHGQVQPFTQFVKKTGVTICGHQALALLLNLIEQSAFGDVEPRVIAYAQSNPLVDDSSESVSYAGLLFTNQQWHTLTPRQQMSQFERTELLHTARLALNHLFDVEFEKMLYAPMSTPLTRAIRGAFVTLKVRATGALRGCIGLIQPADSLAVIIPTLVRDAALHDMRFSPVTPAEVAALTIELSLLTPARRIKGPEDIELGTHGIILHHGRHQAVYLPEVAVEQGWDVPTTLNSLSEKAGLPANAWHDKETWFDVFESIKISE